jgi:multiple sugar transport system permease protein
MADAAATRRRGAGPKRLAGAGLRWIVLLGVALFCVVPLLWLLLAPTRTNAQLSNGGRLGFGSFANVAHAWHHLTGYDNGVIYTWLWNSVWYTAVTVLVAVVTSLLAGYALATTRMWGRELILTITLFAMVIPPAALVLPLFMEINVPHLTDTAVSVILPASLYPFGVYLAFIYFSTSLPRGVLEAAAIDGCNGGQAFLRIALPLAKPLVGLLVFFAFVANWTSYFFPYVLLSDEKKYTLPVGLGALISGTPALNPALGASTVPIHKPEVALAGLVIVGPIVLVFLFSQRALVRGILAGSVKD